LQRNRQLPVYKFRTSLHWVIKPAADDGMHTAPKSAVAFQ